MISQGRHLTRSLYLKRYKGAHIPDSQSRVFQTRRYYRPRYLSSSSLLAEWCYGNFDESEMSRFGSPMFGEDIKGSRGNNLKSVSPLTMASYDNAMPEPRLPSDGDKYVPIVEM